MLVARLAAPLAVVVAMMRLRDPPAQPEPVKAEPAEHATPPSPEMESARAELVRIMASPNLYDYANFTLEYRDTILKALAAREAE